jgi:hypothetical protein
MQRPGPLGWGLGVGLTTLSCKKKIVEKPPRNSAGFCGGSQGKKEDMRPPVRKYPLLYNSVYGLSTLDASPIFHVISDKILPLSHPESL